MPPSVGVAAASDPPASAESPESEAAPADPPSADPASASSATGISNETGESGVAYSVPDLVSGDATTVAS